MSEQTLAELAVLRQLVMALFDASPDQGRVLRQFAETTARQLAEANASSASNAFVDEFQLIRGVYLALLAEASGHAVPPLDAD